jgi:DNA-binding MarR family transcriptional regulator
MVALEQARTIASQLLSLTRQIFRPDDALVAQLTVSQLRLCGTLYDGPRPMSAVSRELGISLSAMTQITDRLERARMVKRVTEGSDRRIKCLQLTRRGEEIMRRREDDRVRRVLAAIEHLSPETRTEVVAGLESLLSACMTSAAKPLPTEAAG